MHFSIPDTETVRTSETSYTVYKVFINGKYHAGMRYSNFHTLHEKLSDKLKRELRSLRPHLPPKKLLPLSTTQLEERRAALEKYIQTLGSIDEVVRSELFRSYLRSAQHETYGNEVENKSIHIYLPNGQKITIDVPSNAPPSTLLRLIGDNLELKPELQSYFSLYLFQRTPDGIWKVVGKLEEYECCWVSLVWSDSSRVVLRKSNWERCSDGSVEKDPVGLHLTYVQAVADIENGWTQVEKEELRKLAQLQKDGNTYEYVQLAKKCKYYGCVKFPNGVVMNSGVGGSSSSPTTIIVGNRELICLSPLRQELVFKVTRIKCWRISLHHEEGGGVECEMSCEYLASRDKLEWLKLSSPQAVLIGLSLQEMVTEMILKNNTSTTTSTNNLRRCGESSSSEESQKSASELNGMRRGSSVEIVTGRVKFRNCSRDTSVFSFSGIGDDDL